MAPCTLESGGPADASKPSMALRGPRWDWHLSKPVLRFCREQLRTCHNLQSGRLRKEERGNWANAVELCAKQCRISPVSGRDRGTGLPARESGRRKPVLAGDVGGDAISHRCPGDHRWDVVHDTTPTIGVLRESSASIHGPTKVVRRKSGPGESEPDEQISKRRPVGTFSLGRGTGRFRSEPRVREGDATFAGEHAKKERGDEPHAARPYHGAFGPQGRSASSLDCCAQRVAC
jgi:hypothetical protein